MKVVFYCILSSSVLFQMQIISYPYVYCPWMTVTNVANCYQRNNSSMSCVVEILVYVWCSDAKTSFVCSVLEVEVLSLCEKYCCLCGYNLYLMFLKHV